MDRIDCLQHLARRQLARSYLEIGVKNGDTFLSVRVPRKIGVDPAPLSRRKRVKAVRSYLPNLLTVLDPRLDGERLAADPGDPGRLAFEDLDRNRDSWLASCDPVELDRWLDHDPALARVPLGE